MSIGRITGKGAAEQLIGIEEMLRKQVEKQMEQAETGGQGRAETVRCLKR